MAAAVGAKKDLLGQGSSIGSCVELCQNVEGPEAAARCSALHVAAANMRAEVRAHMHNRSI